MPSSFFSLQTLKFQVSTLQERRLFLPTSLGTPLVSCIDGRGIAWLAAFRTKSLQIESHFTILCLSPLHGAVQREKDVEAQCLTSSQSCTPGSSAEQVPPRKLPLHPPISQTNNNKKNSKNIPTNFLTLPILQWVQQTTRARLHNWRPILQRIQSPTQSYTQSSMTINLLVPKHLAGPRA